MKTKPDFYFMVSDYYATGEGSVVMILITRADMLTEEEAIQNYREYFGGYHASGVEILERDEFLIRYGNHIPQYLYNLTDPDSDFPGIVPAIHYTSTLHLNT